MELNEIEALLKLANQSTNSKSEAVEKLHQLKFIQNRLLLGLQLFLRGSQEQAQFFGLSLIRECLQSSLLGPEEEDHRRVVRESIWPYLNAQGAEIPTYYVNNLLSIVALLIKWDYPNLWPSAFQELLLLSKRDGLRTNLFLITVMQEFEIEVVAFNDSRSKEEVARNTHIKDVMRSTGVTYALTEFLCEVIINILDNISQAVGLNEIRSMEDAVRKALLRLSELFSWIDASIVRQALPLVFKCSMMFGENFSVQVEALICLRELLKRGMDAKTRLGLLQDLQLIPFICSLPFCQQSSKAKMKSNISERDFETDLQCARVIDLIFTEFASWVSLHEDSILPLKASSPEGTFSSINHNDGMNSSSAKSSSPSTLELVLPYLQFIHNSLHSLMKVVVRVLLNCCVSVTLAVTTSLQRILMLMKLQGTRSVKFAGQYAALLSVKEFDYFNTSRYLSEIQHALLFQSFYPDDMDFSEVEDDEDLQSLIEEKREVRRLFISFAKQNGAEALTRIASLIASEGSPGLTAIQYEAIFRLLASSAEFLADQLSEFPAFMAYIMNLDRRIFDHIESKIAFVELLVKFQNLSSLNGRTALLQVILEGFSVSTLLANATSSRNSHSVYYTQEIQVKFSQSLLKLLEGIGNGASANSVKETMFLQAKDVLAGIVVQVMTSLTLNSEGFIPVLANVSPSGNRLKKKNLVDQTVFQIFEAISLIICERSQDDQGNETFRALSSQIDYFQRIVQFLFELSEQMLLRGQTLLEASSHVNQFNQEIFESQLIRILTAISCVFKHIPKPSFHNFPQAFQLISSLLQKLLENPHSQRAEGVRLKIITILHFYMTSLELGYYQSFLPHFGLMIRTVGSIREMESLTQLLIQLMSTHPKDVTRPLLLDCYEIVTQACLHFNSNFERLLMSQTLSFEHEISAVENDRGLTFRILLNFHQQIMATRLDELFLSSFGRSTPQDLSQLFILIPGIFNEMSPTSLKLQRSSCVPLKRLCCTLVNSFISNWLISPDSPQLVSESTRSIIGLLETFLHERWLPLLIVNLSPGFILRSSRSQQLQQLVKQSLAPSFPGGLLNCKDAATQPVIGEIATTFFFLFFRTEGALMEGAKPSDSFVVYITGLLQQLEWPPEYQQLFFNLLIVKGSSSSSHLTTYKENFLKFARSLPT